MPPLKGSGPVINLLGLYGVLGVVAGIRIHRPRARLAWWCFALGLALFWLGDIYTYSYPKLFGADVPFPSLGDAIYLAVYPALMIGLVVLVRRRNQRADGPGAVDALIMTLGLSLISGILLIAPYIHDRTLTLLPKLVSIGYPMGDIILLAAGIRLAVDAGKRRPAFYLLIASIVTLLATDFVYGLFTLHNAYTHQLWMDAGWIFFYLLWAAAALHPSMQELSEVEADRNAAADLVAPRAARGGEPDGAGARDLQGCPDAQLGPAVRNRRLGAAVRAGGRAHDRARAPAREVGVARARTERRRWPAGRRDRPAGDRRRRAPGSRRLRRHPGRCPRAAAWPASESRRWRSTTKAS